MAFNWDSYKDRDWFGTDRQKEMDGVFQAAYILGERGQTRKNPFNNLPSNHPLQKDPDLLLGLQKAFDDGIKDGAKVRENREIHQLRN